jgi:hypothetical protein
MMRTLTARQLSLTNLYFSLTGAAPHWGTCASAILKGGVMHVTWSIDTEDDTPLRAAINSFVLMRLRTTTANFFTTVHDDNDVDVDLQKELAENPKARKLFHELSEEHAEYFGLQASDKGMAPKIAGPYSSALEAYLNSVGIGDWVLKITAESISVVPCQI